VTSDLSLAVIGGGRMGEALIGGLLAAGTLIAERISVAEVDPARRVGLTERFGVRAFERVGEAIGAAVGQGGQAGEGGPAGRVAVLLAVKPQQIDAVAAEVGAALPAGATVISIAAGVPTTRLEERLGGEPRVVRVMPNQAAFAGMAVSAVSGGRFATEADLELTVELMGAVGDALVLPESLQNAVTAISGSGPAYVYLFAQALIDAGMAQGLTRDQAWTLVVETIRGAGEMLAQGDDPADLIRAVASPGGTTVAALEAFEKAGLVEALAAGVEAAARRAEELGRAGGGAAPGQGS
jgi:pyrroline-5-carboxylate reductase